MSDEATPATTTVVATTPTTEVASTTVKPGWLTSEHLMSYAAMALTAAFGSGLIPTDGTVTKVAVMAAIFLTNAGYVVARTVAKS